MKTWPTDYAEVVIGGYQVQVRPLDLLLGISNAIPNWVEPGAKDQAFLRVGKLLTTREYADDVEFQEDVQKLADASAYATLGTVFPEACQWCVDTLNELVP